MMFFATCGAIIRRYALRHYMMP